MAITIMFCKICLWDNCILHRVKSVWQSSVFTLLSGFLGSILCCCLPASGMGSGRVCVAGRTDSFQDVWQSGTDDGLFLRSHFAVLSV